MDSSVLRQQWISEVQRALKVEQVPDFIKIIFDQKINAISYGDDERCFQKQTARLGSFLTVQNYNDLVNSNMSDWLHSSNVGLRFKQLKDLSVLSGQSNIQNKSVFLSQPFAFPLSEAHNETFDAARGHLSQLNLGWSPSSFGLTRGEILKRPYKDWEIIFKNSRLLEPHVRWFYLSSASFQWAGADRHMEIAILIALAIDSISEFETIGLTAAEVIPRITFGLSLGTDILLESAKVTALKRVWAKVCELYTVSSVETTEVYGLPSLRQFSGRDPWNNIMRISLMSVAAVLGGAEGFKCIPYDVLRVHKNADAIRTSTNIPLLLTQEGLLDKVSNPFDGSPLFTNAVEVLCEQAWKSLQDIESKGGIFEAIRSGWLQSDIRRAADAEKEKVKNLQTSILGVNKFVAPLSTDPSTAEIVKLQDIIDPLFLRESDDDFLSVEPLLVESLCYEWEKMQLIFDTYKQRHQEYPMISVIKGAGPVAEKKMAWLKSILSLAPFRIELLSIDSESRLSQSLSKIVLVLPSSTDVEENVLSMLKSEKVEKVFYVGEERANISFDGYIDSNANAFDFLKQLQDQLVGNAWHG